MPGEGEPNGEFVREETLRMSSLMDPFRGMLCGSLRRGLGGLGAVGVEIGLHAGSGSSFS